MFDFGPTERNRRGLIGRDWTINHLSSKIMCDSMAEGIETTIKNFQPRKRFNLYKVKYE